MSILPSDNDFEKPFMNRFGMEMTRNSGTWINLAKKYNISPFEIAQIDFNRSGIFLPNAEVREDFRVRFKGRLFNSAESWFALPVRRAEDTLFRGENGKIFFGNGIIGQTEELLLDTCESSYQRGPTLLNLNSRSRSNCGGCTACVHTYKNLYDGTVIKDNQPIVTQEDFEQFLSNKNIDVSKLDQIAVVTGLFGSEEKVIEHMKIINEVAQRKGFTGELMYFGCEVNSEKALDQLAQISNFAIIYAIDNFTKRDRILAKVKSHITMDMAKQTLMNAKNRGINTSVAYISGIDSLEDMQNGFNYIKESLTRFPVINIYQIQTRGQSGILDEKAKTLEYYVRSRVKLEEAFIDSDLRPRRWENYRPLWYEYFASEKMTGNSYGEKEKIASSIMLNHFRVKHLKMSKSRD